MSKFHVNVKTGLIGPCSAQKGKCPFGGESGEDNHYDSVMDAARAYETLVSKDNDPNTQAFATYGPGYSEPQPVISEAEAISLAKAENRLAEAQSHDFNLRVDITKRKDLKASLESKEKIAEAYEDLLSEVEELSVPNRPQLAQLEYRAANNQVAIVSLKLALNEKKLLPFNKYEDGETLQKELYTARDRAAIAYNNWQSAIGSKNRKYFR